jgi:dolichol-phosphate mannosyltransferase
LITMGSVWVIIPTYNEAENIDELIGRLVRVFEENNIDYHILVIDDNSPDGTADIVRGWMQGNDRIHLIVREGKQGLGSAVLTGIRYAFEKDPNVEFFVTMDADLSHRPEDLPGMLRLAREADVVQGSRYVEGGRIIGWGFHRKLISSVANMLIRLLYHTGLRDNTSNYRVYNRRAAKLLLKYAGGKSYEWAIESILIPTAAGLRLVEAPITFINRMRGKSKLGFKDIIEWWSYIVGFRRRFKEIAAREAARQQHDQ